MRFRWNTAPPPLPPRCGGLLSIRVCPLDACERYARAGGKMVNGLNTFHFSLCCGRGVCIAYSRTILCTGRSHVGGSHSIEVRQPKAFACGRGIDGRLSLFGRARMFFGLLIRFDGGSSGGTAHVWNSLGSSTKNFSQFGVKFNIK